MIAVLQRVTEASVSIDNAVIAKTGPGILALVAIEKSDTEKEADRLIERILNYRVFSDQQGKMNLCLKDCNGELLLVPQFTLAADTDSGNRPSFTPAASPQRGRKLFEYLVTTAYTGFTQVQSGRFGADMQVALINDGPVTFRLRVIGQ